MVVQELIGRGLADVDDGQPVEMPGLDLGGAVQAGRGWPLAREVGTSIYLLTKPTMQFQQVYETERAKKLLE